MDKQIAQNKARLLAKLAELGFDKSILDAFARVRREDFVPEDFKKVAYEDVALSIGFGQTISQPQTIAFMLDLLNICDGQKILEVGSGSGYVLALLKEIAPNSKLYGAEIVPELVEKSQQILQNKPNIYIKYTPKKLGIPQLAPYERILTSASAVKIPQKLIAQLAPNGILVCPVQNFIIKLTKIAGKTSEIQKFSGFAFVPLIES